MNTPPSHSSAADLRKRINGALRSFFDAEAGSARHAFGRRIMRSIKEYTLRPGAKRTRGTLVVLGFLSNPRNRATADILKVAAAYEVLHAYLLIHDDIIDEDVVRRGRPTLHKVFESYAPRGLAKADREKVGRDIAIIAGDIASDLVQRCVLSTGFSLAQKMSALEDIERTLHTTYIGQVLDILALPEKVPPIDQQFLRYQHKTAVYTIESPFLLGVRLGRARIPTKAFHAFARDAGIAFQLTDDVQNVFSRGLAGRSSDIRSGKITLLISFALQSKRHSATLLRLLRKRKKSGRDLVRLKALIVESGGYERARRYITNSFRRASILLDNLDIPDPVQKEFKRLVHKLAKQV